MLVSVCACVCVCKNACVCHCVNMCTGAHGGPELGIF